MNMAALEIDKEDVHDRKKWRRNVMKRHPTLSENRLLTDIYIFELYISLVYSPFSDRVGLPPHNTPFPGVLMKSI